MTIKLFIFGIDGASFDIINNLIKQGYLKNFKKIMEQGSYANMITIPPKTIPMWPCLFSGLTPVQLGYFDFFQKGILFTSDKIQGRTVFDILNSKKKIVLNLPGSYPAWKINKYMVSGEHAPILCTYPANFKKDPVFDGYILHEKAKNLKHCLKAFNSRAKFTKNMLKKEQFDFVLFASTFSESAVNHLPKTKIDGSQYRKAFQQMDDFLGKLMRDPNIDNIVIMSDHGTSRYIKQFNIKRYFEKKDLLKQSKAKYKTGVFWLLSKIGLSKLIYSIIFKIQPIKRLLKRKTKKSNQQKIFYAFSSNFGAIYEPDIKKLNKIKNLLEKENIVKNIEYTKNLFGAYKQGLPQILIELKENILLNTGEHCFEMIRFDQLGHSKKGIFIAHGKDIKPLGQIKDISYLDLAPTILYFFDHDKTEWMKGKAIKDIFKKKKENLKKTAPTHTLQQTIDKIKI